MWADGGQGIAMKNVAKSKRTQRKPLADAMTLMNLTTGKWVSQAISVAAEFGVADILKDGSKTAAEVAKATHTSEDGVYRLLRALSKVGLFVERGNRRFRLTKLGQLLRSDAPQSVRGFARFVGHDSTWRPWGELRHSVRTSEPAFDHVFGMPIFEYFGKSAEAAAVFNAAMTSISTFEAKAVVGAYDFSQIQSVVDVAGGHGLLIATVLKAYKGTRGILFDLPHVTVGAAALLQQHGVAGRCEIVAGDFFGSIPEGADAYMMKHIIHDWDDDRAIQIVLNCRRAMRPGAKLLIVDVVVDSAGAEQYGCFLDLEMLTLTPRGRERTRAEFGRLLQRSGFKLRRVIATDSYLSVVEATRV
jgi:hypothetical protein